MSVAEPVATSGIVRVSIGLAQLATQNSMILCLKKLKKFLTPKPFMGTHQIQQNSEFNT
jgi:hypothetical protein